MMKSRRNYSVRCRPLFGTLVRVHLDGDEQQAFEKAFEQLSALEWIFNFHNSASEVSVFNSSRTAGEIKVSPVFVRLLRFSLLMREETQRAFTPFVEEQRGEHVLSAHPVKIAGGNRVVKNERCRLDFGGVAKGFAVDQAVEKVVSDFPKRAGFIEAGGDIRYFGKADTHVTLRLGIPPFVVHRELQLRKPAVATSSPGVSQAYGPSKTHYSPDAIAGATVVVMAEDCATADALTKAVKPNGPPRAGADALFFDLRGECIASLCT